LPLFDRKRFSFSPITGLFRREVNRLSESIFSIFTSCHLRSTALQATEKELKN